jgi:hypothetical protein
MQRPSRRLVHSLGAAMGEEVLRSSLGPLITRLPEAIEIAVLDAVEIVVEPFIWSFAQARRAEIERHFAIQQRQRPALWNGRVLLLHRYTQENRVLRGASFETDYASFLAWRDWGFPAPGVFNIFAAAALQTADGAFLLGQMAPFTSAAGQWVFPCGTPEPDDINSAGMLDLVGNLGRELFEETGVNIADCQVEPGWTVLCAGQPISIRRRCGFTSNILWLNGRSPTRCGNWQPRHHAKHCSATCRFVVGWLVEQSESQHSLQVPKEQAVDVTVGPSHRP